MNAKVETHNDKSYNFLWVFAFLLIAGALAANFYYAEYSLLFRMMGLVLSSVIALALVSRSQAGRRAWQYWCEATEEVRRMVWPTRKEVLQSTGAVLLMAFVMGLLLWGVDTFLLWAVSAVNQLWWS